MANMFTEDDDALLSELGIEVEKKKQVTRTPREERIIAGFEDIQKFVAEHGRLPRHSEAGDIFERLYAVRLQRLRELPEAADLLADLDAGGQPLPEVDAFFQAVGARVTHGGARACYVPAEDRIQMPPVSAFISAQHYTATLCHEVTHWTGHRSRLDRFKMGSTKADYAREELIAEIGSCFLAQQARACIYGHFREYNMNELSVDRTA